MYAPTAPPHPAYGPYPTYSSQPYPYQPAQPPYGPPGGSVVAVDYVRREPAPYPHGHGPPSNCVTVCRQPPPQPCVAPSSDILVLPRSRYLERYGGPPRFKPPAPPRYRAPTPPPPSPPSSPLDPNLKPWFGVNLKWLDDLTAGGTDNVAVVESVIPDSPAFKANLRANDQLEFFNGEKIDGRDMWISKMKAMRIGDTVNIDIHRNGVDLEGFKVHIEGTRQQLGNKRLVQSATAVETDNFE